MPTLREDAMELIGERDITKEKQWAEYRALWHPSETESVR